jgi:G6PDH family F420-dependent oxidoreductase
MARLGYTLMTEQAGPKELVRHAALAEDVGFDFEVMSDHYFPWLAAQGHAPYAWSVLGAVAHVTSRVELMTYVTCPTIRYHPAVVAQKAATVQLLADGRFTLGLGSGENLNEHVVGADWPIVARRQNMLAEAIEIIRKLHEGGLVDHEGDYFEVASARIWDLPDEPVPLAVAVSGPASIERLAPLADHMVGVDPDAEVISTWNDTEGAPRIGSVARAFGQVPFSWDPDEEAAVERAHEQFRWFAGGFAVNADLPTTAGFAGATQYVRPSDVAEAIPCGPDLDRIVETAQKYWDAGYTDLSFVQVGGDTQERFLDEAARPLLEKLRAAAP